MHVCMYPRHPPPPSRVPAPRLNFVLRDGTTKPIDASIGDTLLEVAQKNDLDVEGACEGVCACSTCHMIFEESLFDELPRLTEDEEDMLDLAAGLTET
jgi:ferredoxin